AVADFNQDGYADVFFTNHQYSFSGDPNLANRMIVSYLYFGSEDGFSKENRQEFQTIGAWGTKAADLNEDGWVDLFVNNFQEHYSYEVPSFIYWNGPDGFSLTKRTPIYEHGAQGNAVADFDGDGHVDLAVTSMMGRSRGDYDPCHLYFGDEN
ncbi:MAG: VCBS repeat-containing protein, partial [Candidatus Omnitrophica bacterium]|nr:VCBS repeat-containing protein [Candidatus Omnitrophota bacterium]